MTRLGTLALLSACILLGGLSSAQAGPLARGYIVHGTLRDWTDPTKAPLLSFPGAAARLSLFNVDMADETLSDVAVADADCVLFACLIPVYVPFCLTLAHVAANCSLSSARRCGTAGSRTIQLAR